MKTKELSQLMEWAVWAHLDSQKNIELVLLKGHLMLEVMVNSALSSHFKQGSASDLGLSFHKKVELLERFRAKGDPMFSKVKQAIFQVNRIRNRLAHNWQFESQEELSTWAESVLAEFPCEKFTRFTFRTRIVHAFATLAREVSELHNPSSVTNELERIEKPTI